MKLTGFPGSCGAVVVHAFTEWDGLPELNSQEAWEKFLTEGKRNDGWAYFASSLVLAYVYKSAGVIREKLEKLGFVPLCETQSTHGSHTLILYGYKMSGDFMKL